MGIPHREFPRLYTTCLPSHVAQAFMRWVLATTFQYIALYKNRKRYVIAHKEGNKLYASRFLERALRFVPQTGQSWNQLANKIEAFTALFNESSMSHEM